MGHTVYFRAKLSELDAKHGYSERLVVQSISHCIALYRIVSHRIASYRIVSHCIASYRIVSHDQYRIVMTNIASHRHSRPTILATASIAWYVIVSSVTKKPSLHDVASILARRVAVEFSDSDSASESEYDSEGWAEQETSA